MKKFLAIFTVMLTFAGIAFFYPLNINENLEQKWIFYDRNGEILYTEKPFFTAEKWENEFFKKSLISLEDQNFENHFGVDFSGILRASFQNFQTGKTVSGASTITMQLAKLVFLPREKHNYWYKIRQIWYALKLDSQFSKDEILAKYLEKINFGNNAIGFSAAAQKYFGKNPANLSIGETATLLAIIQNPSQFNPLQNPAKNLERRNFILQRLKSREILSAEDYDFWRAKKIKLTPQFSGEIIAPHFIFWVRNQLNTRDFKSAEIHVYTTLDKKLYKQALKISREILEKNGKNKNISNSAVVILDAENKIRVMLGSPDFFNKEIDGAVNLATSPRQTGSVLKPFLYTLAVNQGMSPLTELRDEKQIFPSGYFPRNFNIREENGSVRFREALANSYNIAAVRLLNQIGAGKFYNFCQNSLHLVLTESAKDLGLSLILGSGSSSLLNLTRAYSVFPHHGELREIQFVTKVLDERGENIMKKNPPNHLSKKEERKTVFSRDSAEWGQHVLSDNQARWKNFSRGNSLELEFASGAKTGTSQEFKDNWVLGFSRNFTVGVWVGNADGSAMHASSGMQGAGPIWQRVMQMLPQNPAKKFQYSGNRKEKIVCRRPFEKNCTEKVTAFVLDKPPRPLIRGNIQNSRDFDYVGAENLQPDEEQVLPASHSPEAGEQLKIVYPRDGDVFMENSDLLIQVRGENFAKISYFLDGEKLENSIIKNLSSGAHFVLVESEIGEKDEIGIEVR